MMAWLRAVERMKLLKYMYRVRVDVVTGCCPGTRHTYTVTRKELRSCTHANIELGSADHASVSAEVSAHTRQKFRIAQQGIITDACVNICTLLCIQHQKNGKLVQNALGLWKKVLKAVNRVHRVKNTEVAMAALERKSTKARKKTEARYGTVG